MTQTPQGVPKNRPRASADRQTTPSTHYRDAALMVVAAVLITGVPLVALWNGIDLGRRLSDGGVVFLSLGLLVGAVVLTVKGVRGSLRERRRRSGR